MHSCFAVLCVTTRSIVLLSQVALQFLVNCVTGNEENQVIVWQLFFPDHFQVCFRARFFLTVFKASLADSCVEQQKVLVECQEHRKIVAFAAALVLNCINSKESDSEVDTRRVDLVRMACLSNSPDTCRTHECYCLLASVRSVLGIW